MATRNRRKKKYIIPLIIILILGIGTSYFFFFHNKTEEKDIGKINEKQVSETPAEKDKESAEKEESEELQNNKIGHIEFSIPEGYETPDYSFDLSQTYTSDDSYFMVSKDEDATIGLYKDLYPNGETKDIGEYSGYYYKTQIDEEVIHGYVFNVNDELYHITSNSYETIEDFVKSINTENH